MIYADYLSTAEMHRWILDTDIAWDDDRCRRWRSRSPACCERVRDSALIESFFPIFTCRAMECLWDDLSATAVFSIQLYESYKHFHVFNQYLQRVGDQPIDDDELVAIRRRNEALRFDDGTRLLTRYMMSEHFAAFHFMKDAGVAASRCSATSSNWSAATSCATRSSPTTSWRLRIQRDPAEAHKVIEEARTFRHIGVEVVAGRADRRKERVCGVGDAGPEDQTSHRRDRGMIEMGGGRCRARVTSSWKLNWYRQSELEGALLLGKDRPPRARARSWSGS